MSAGTDRDFPPQTPGEPRPASFRWEWVNWALLTAMFLVAAVVWPRVPKRLPVHWDAAGNADRVGGRFEGLLLLPLLATVLYGLMWAGRGLLVTRASNAKTALLDRVRLATNAFFVLLHATLVAGYLGIGDGSDAVMPLAGLLMLWLAWEIGRAGPAAVNGPFSEEMKQQLAPACGVSLGVTGVAFLAAGLLESATAVYIAVAIAVASTPACFAWAALRSGGKPDRGD